MKKKKKSICKKEIEKKEREKDCNDDKLEEKLPLPHNYTLLKEKKV